MHTCADVINSVPFFDDAEEGFVASLVTMLHPQVGLPILVAMHFMLSCCYCITLVHMLPVCLVAVFYNVLISYAYGGVEGKLCFILSSEVDEIRESGQEGR